MFSSTDLPSWVPVSHRLATISPWPSEPKLTEAEPVRLTGWTTRPSVKRRLWGKPSCWIHMPNRHGSRSGLTLPCAVGVAVAVGPDAAPDLESPELEVVRATRTDAAMARSGMATA